MTDWNSRKIVPAIGIVELRIHLATHEIVMAGRGRARSAQINSEQTVGAVRSDQHAIGERTPRHATPHPVPRGTHAGQRGAAQATTLSSSINAVIILSGRRSPVTS